MMQPYLNAWLLKCQLGAEWLRLGQELVRSETAYVQDVLLSDSRLWAAPVSDAQTARLACKRFARDLAFVHDVSTDMLESQSRQWALIHDSAEGVPGAADFTEPLPEFFHNQKQLLSKTLSRVGREHGRMAYAYPVQHA